MSPSESQESASRALRETVASLPKVELHIHLEGSLDNATVKALAARHNVGVPSPSAGVRFDTFSAFADRFLANCHLLRTSADFSLAVYNLGRNLAQQNVRYAEVMWAPQIHLWKRKLPDQVLAGLNLGRARVKEEFGVELRWIIDLLRRNPQVAAKVVSWACEKDRSKTGIIAIGLGGPERERSAEPFVPLFEMARQHGLSCSPHAGEDGSAVDIWYALDNLKAQRIGHGIRAIEDPALVAILAERRVPLEVCPTSNVALSLAESYKNHPLKQMIQAGCLVTINSDDPGIFDTTLSQEYWHAVADCGISIDELKTTVLNGVTASFLPEDEKQDLLRQIKIEIPV